MSSTKGSFFCIWLLPLMLFGVAFQAQANSPLSRQLAEAYVSLLPQVRAFSDRLDPVLGQQLQGELQPRSGEPFQPHRKGLEILRQRQAGDYRELTGLVRQGGFASAEDWARVGDQVLLGYAALKADQAGPELLQLAAGMDGMDPQMLALMPPQLQARMTQLAVLARVVAAVEPADRAIVRPLLPRLDAYWRRDWQQYRE
ncbi:hypothetical protein [Marinobacterium aestuariivivens]|uniref:DUF2059 domain-containing protein n=1 Tax=Marinobacterium aestuariivivens TaxID=1698799 RepID=A0ABW1ZW14_9GAMM